MNLQKTFDQSPGRNRRTIGGWLLLAAALAVAFGHNFAEMWLRWFPGWQRLDVSLYQQITQTESYYTHAPLVPLVSLLIIFLLIRYTSIPLNPRRISGLLLLVGSVLLHLIASFARVNFISGFAFIGVLAGLTLLLWGFTALRRLWFPIAFLFFMVPLPEISIAQLNFRLKILACDWGVALANLIGVIAERSSNQVFLEGNKILIIANVCNGLRTLISVMAFGALYAYVCRLKGIWRIFLFAMSIPVAVVSNALRIVGLILVADTWSVKAATGWFHDFSGFMILVMSFLLLFGLERIVLGLHALLGRPVPVTALFHHLRRTTGERNQGKLLFGAIRSGNGLVGVIMVVLTAGGAWWLNRALPPVYTEDILKNALPAKVNIDGAEWVSYVLDFDAQTLVVLETEAAILRRYVCPPDNVVDFCLVFSRDNRKGTHPPDLCLEGGGQNIIAKNKVLVTGIPGWKKLSCRELVTRSATTQMYYLYTYKCGHSYTDSFWRQQAMIFLNGLLHRNASGALIRVSTTVETGVDDARAKVTKFLRLGIPYLDRTLP